MAGGEKWDRTILAHALSVNSNVSGTPLSENLPETAVMPWSTWPHHQMAEQYDKGPLQGI